MASILYKFHVNNLLKSRYLYSLTRHPSTVRFTSSDPKTTKSQENNKFDDSNNNNEQGSQNDSKKKSRANAPKFQHSPITWKSLLVGATMVILPTIYFMKLKADKIKTLEQNANRSIGQAAIHGEFELVDTEGKIRTSEEFRGKWLLVYFGFTHCPDVCPEELEKLSIVLEKLLVKHKLDVVPLFITVDPERDTPQLLKKYLAEFTDKFIGLSGTKEQVEKATRAFRIYYSMGPKDRDGDYIVDHSIITYLIDPKGDLLDYYGQTRTAEDIENSVLMHVKLKKKLGLI